MRRATFRLGDRLLFPDTSWTLHSNEQWAVVGPNGSGKSLFGDALRGRLPLVAGELTYHFKQPLGFTPEDCIGHIAFEDRRQTIHDRVVQSRWQTFEQDQAELVRDILSYEKVMDVNPFEISSLRKEEKRRFERRQRRAVKLLGIEPLLERRFMVLSNGETQKVLLARTLCVPLRLLILDEPFAGLDAESQGHFRKILKTLMSSRLRMILITADSESLPPEITNVMRVEESNSIYSRRRWRENREPKKRRLRLNGKGDQSLVRSSSTTRRSSGGGELVRMRNVTVKYDDVTVLENINWTIRAGQSWALLGPNGSGKTTLLSLILGDHPQAYSNDITVLGRKLGSGVSVWNLRERIGWVSPELHLHFQNSFTCLETIESGFHDTAGLYEKVAPDQRRRAKAWLKRFGLGSFGEAPLCELSAGLQRVVFLARAMVKNPALLILDEPCQGLDPEHRAMFLQMLDRLLRAGKETAIYVTHREQEIPSAIRHRFRLVCKQV